MDNKYNKMIKLMLAAAFIAHKSYAFALLR